MSEGTAHAALCVARLAMRSLILHLVADALVAGRGKSDAPLHVGARARAQRAHVKWQACLVAEDAPLRRPVDAVQVGGCVEAVRSG
eukprot:137680-Prymnesium_polylepis.1